MSVTNMSCFRAFLAIAIGFSTVFAAQAQASEFEGASAGPPEQEEAVRAATERFAEEFAALTGEDPEQVARITALQPDIARLKEHLLKESGFGDVWIENGRIKVGFLDRGEERVALALRLVDFPDADLVDAVSDETSADGLAQLRQRIEQDVAVLQQDGIRVVSIIPKPQTNSVELGIEDLSDGTRSMLKDRYRSGALTVVEAEPFTFLDRYNGVNVCPSRSTAPTQCALVSICLAAMAPVAVPRS